MMVKWSVIASAIDKIKEIMTKDSHNLHSLPEDMTAQIEQRADGIFNPIEALDADQVKIYNEFKALEAELDADTKVAIEFKNKLETKFNRVKNLEKNFTSTIELKHNLDDKMWRVNEKTGMVEVFDQERALKEMDDLGFHLPPNMFKPCNNEMDN